MWKNMEKRRRPDWGNTARVAMAVLGSIGLRNEYVPCHGFLKHHVSKT